MPELQPWHLTHLINPDYNRVDLVKEGANSQAKIKLYKSRGGTGMTFEEILKGLKPEHAAVITDVLKAKDQDIEEAGKKAAEATAKAEKMEEEVAKAAPAKEQTQEEILKSVKDPAVRALLETQITKAKVAEEEVRKSRETALTAEATSVAKGIPNLGAEETALAGVYKKLKTADAALAEEVFGIFKSANALIAAGGVFAEVGKTAEGVIGGSEDAAWAAIEAKADEIAKSRGIGKAAAISKATSENPALYEAYLAAQRGY